ncbi:hypothetical protein TNCV_2911191 [Trichonephila clavipes]|nr:hypothetical protein TNCV_2911191 [Trichonephila clavipes]
MKKLIIDVAEQGIRSLRAPETRPISFPEQYSCLEQAREITHLRYLQYQVSFRRSKLTKGVVKSRACETRSL